MLDSSPVALPPIPRPLKRSASVASLPTPPRTRHKKKSTRSSAVYDTDTDLQSSESEGDNNDGEVGNKRHKKRRTSAKGAADEEEAFWMDSGSKAKSDTEVDSKSQATSTSSKSLPEAPPLLYRRGTAGAALVSPPPSNRKTLVSPSPTSPTRTPRSSTLAPSSPPVTPRPLRDSPNNPFLVSSSEESGIGNSADSSPSQPRTPKKERPTVTYVFRGVRGTFPNPMYDHKNNRPLSPSSKSWLPVEHPDFSPSTHCPPKLLFPEARGRRTRKEGKKPQNLGKELENALRKERGQNVRKGKRERSLSWSDDEGDVGIDVQLEQGKIVPTKLNFDVDSEEKEKKN